MSVFYKDLGSTKEGRKDEHRRPRVVEAVTFSCGIVMVRRWFCVCTETPENTSVP